MAIGSDNTVVGITTTPIVVMSGTKRRLYTWNVSSRTSPISSGRSLMPLPPAFIAMPVDLQPASRARLLVPV